MASQFGSDTPWARAAAGKPSSDSSAGFGPSNSVGYGPGESAGSQFGSDTPWAKASQAWNEDWSKNTKSYGSLDAKPEAPSGGSGGVISFSAASVSAPAAAAQPDVKAATPDLVQITEEGMTIEVMTDLLFEDIGGTEILSLSRHDLINGIDIKYQQISNLSKIQSLLGGTSLVSIQNPIEQIFGRFPLKRYQYVPVTTDDPSGLNNHVYSDSSGNINIELYNIEENMQIEIEFKSADTTDIIY